MNSHLKRLTVFILFSFISCTYVNEKDKFNSVKVYSDSVRVYNEKIKTVSSDSLKRNLINLSINLNKKIDNDSIRIKNYDTIAFNFYKINDFVNYKRISKLNLSESIKSKDTNRIIKSYINFGNFYLRRNMHDSAYYNYDIAQKLYIRINEFEKTNELSLNKATIQYFKGDYLGCETTILKSLSFFKNENNDLNLNIAYTLIGLSKIELKEFDEAIDFLTLSLDLAKKANIDKSTIGIALNNIGLVYFKKEDYKKAIEYYEKATKENDLKSNNFQVYTIAMQNLAFARYKLGDKDDFIKNILEVIKNCQELNLSTVQPKVYLSEYYENQGDILKAQELAIESYNISIKEKLYRDKLIALKQLTAVFPEKSKLYSSDYIKLSDSIAAVDKKVQNTFARIEYRVDELNSENLLLAERNKQIIYYSVIGVLIISMFYFYRWQKQKQKELILIQEQQQANEEVYTLMIDQQNKMDQVKAHEQKRISQELHDAILGKLFGARMNLDFLNNQMSDEVKKDKEKYIHEIIEVEKQIRQISHELNDEKRAIINNYKLMIDKLVEEQEKLLGLKIDYSFNTNIPWERLSAEEKINLYRIFQETFYNIIKYANAKNIIFSFIFANNTLKISILDDGKGFDVKKGAKGIGIKNMYQRASLINANYTIDSEINKGTRTQIELEINPNKEF
jgi:signal transduction histidine kinase